MASALEDRRHAHAACSADRDESAPRAALLQLLGERGDDARPGSGEGMSQRDAASLGIELRTIDRAQRPVATESLPAILFRFPRSKGAQHLCRERFMDFVDIEVLQCETGS